MAPPVTRIPNPSPAELREVEGALSRRTTTPRGRIRVDAPMLLAPSVIVPAQPGFFARFPDIELALACSGRHTDLLTEGIDCARVAAIVRNAPVRAEQTIWRNVRQTQEVIERRALQHEHDDVLDPAPPARPRGESAPRCRPRCNGLGLACRSHRQPADASVIAIGYNTIQCPALSASDAPEELPTRPCRAPPLSALQRNALSGD